MTVNIPRTRVGMVRTEACQLGAGRRERSWSRGRVSGGLTTREENLERA